MLVHQSVDGLQTNFFGTKKHGSKISGFGIGRIETRLQNSRLLLVCADRDEQMSSQDIHFPY